MVPGQLLAAHCQQSSCHRISYSYEMVTLSLRPYLPRDRPACLALLRGNIPPFFAPAEEREFGYWLDTQETGAAGQHYYVAEQAGELVACGGFFLDGMGRATLTWGMVACDRHRWATAGPPPGRHPGPAPRRQGGAGHDPARCLVLCALRLSHHGHYS